MVGREGDAGSLGDSGYKMDCEMNGGVLCRFQTNDRYKGRAGAEPQNLKPVGRRAA